MSFKLKAIATTIFMIILVFIIIYSVNNIGSTWDTSQDWQAKGVEQSINRALLQCYALEGRYPAELDHLHDYGIILNRSIYEYRYEFVANNVRPEVSVVDK